MKKEFDYLELVILRNSVKDRLEHCFSILQSFEEEGIHGNFVESEFEICQSILDKLDYMMNEYIREYANERK